MGWSHLELAQVPTRVALALHMAGRSTPSGVTNVVVAPTGLLRAACVAPVTRAILGNMHWRNTRELHVVCVAGFPVRRLYSHRITPTVISAAFL